MPKTMGTSHTNGVPTAHRPNINVATINNKRKITVPEKHAKNPHSLFAEI